LKQILKDIASVQTGQYVKTVPNGNAVYLQGKHFDNDANMQEKIFPDIRLEDCNPRHLLQKGDILFSAKGERNFAYCHDDESVPAIASTTFFVIRLLSDDILPHYVTWYINHPKTMNKLKKQAIGTNIASIAKSTIEQLEITIPSMQKQHEIIKIMTLRKKEKKLIEGIESLRESYFQNILLQSIEK